MAYIEPANAGEWGCNWSAPVDNGWGQIRGADSLAGPFKTKGLWDFARGTLSCMKLPPRTEATMAIQRICRGQEVRRPIKVIISTISCNSASVSFQEVLVCNSSTHTHGIHRFCCWTDDVLMILAVVTLARLILATPFSVMSSVITGKVCGRAASPINAVHFAKKKQTSACSIISHKHNT